MDLELEKALVADCKKALGINDCHSLCNSKHHLRALKTARGAAMLYRSRFILKTMGYSDQESEIATNKLLKY